MHLSTSFPRNIHVCSPSNTGLQLLYGAVSHYCGDEMHSGAVIERPYGTFGMLPLPGGVIIAHCDHFLSYKNNFSFGRFLHPTGCWWKRQCNQLWVAGEILIKYSKFLTNQRPEQQLIFFLVLSSTRLFLSPQFCTNLVQIVSKVNFWTSKLSTFTGVND